MLPRINLPMPCIKTAFVTETRWVIGDSVLKGTEGPIHRPDPLGREACCLAGAWVEDVKRMLPTLVGPSDCDPLVVFQVCSDEVAMRSLRAIKRDFRVL